MGHPTEPAPEPSAGTPGPRDEDPSRPGEDPSRPGGDQSRTGEDSGEHGPATGADAPYEPAVRLYEQRVIATVPAPTASGGDAGEPTQALPVVAATAPAAASGFAPTGASAPGSPVDPPGTPAAPPGGDQPPASPLDGLSGDGAPSRAPRVALWSGIGLVVLAGVYAGAQWAVADTVPKETTVAGVDVGGLTEPQAVSALEEGLGPRAAEPIAVQAGEASSTIDPASGGLTFDAAATVDGLTGFSLSPARLWEHVVGGGETAPAVDVDDAQLDATVDGLQETLAVAPVDGTVSFDGGKPVATDAEDGSELVVAEASDVIASGWLVEPGPFELPTEAVTPAIDQADTDAALAQAETITGEPVMVTVGDQTVELPGRAIGRATSFEPADGALSPQFDGEKLVSAVVDRTDDLLTEPDDAHFEFSGGRPVVVGGTTGTTLDPDATAKAVGDAALGDDRAVELELTEQDPEYTAAELEGIGVEEVVASFSTPLTSDTVRTQNLIRGAELVTGAFVPPGETFSLLDTLSPITVENGFVASGVVSNGVHTEGVGGGLSQMATTTYNAGFMAGYDDAGHQPHSYWFSRYPAGREATIYVGAIDMKFTNDTPYGAVMQSWVSGGEIHVAIWSSPYWDVDYQAGDKQNVVPTTTVHSSGADCEYYPAGNDGFTITNYRQVSHDGKTEKDESYTWTYKPDNGVVCDEPKADRGTDRDDDAGGGSGKDDTGDDAGRDESSEG
ncbi:VanW family protein [Isoptericola hypogeus]|uniref:VanW family protein n=1 Tax=Isoptericola hypogeus TaxID=300179 RepID=A0ABP4UV41_9MICO